MKRKKDELERANIALQEVLDRVEGREGETLKKIREKIENLIRPHFEKLKKKIDPKNEKHLEAIEDYYQEIFGSGAEGLSQLREKLTTREFEICTYIKQGLTSKEIASVIGRSDSTINNHRESIRKKLELTNKSIQLSEYLNNLE